MKAKLLSTLAAVPLFAIATVASASEAVALNDVQMDAVSAGAIAFWKGDSLAVGFTSATQIYAVASVVTAKPFEAEGTIIVPKQSTVTISSISVSGGPAGAFTPVPVPPINFVPPLVPPQPPVN